MFVGDRLLKGMRLIDNLLTLATACVAMGALSAQSTDVPDWQTTAGGKMAFEVASVKPTKTFRPSLFDISTGNAVAPGGRFFGVFPLFMYITFAYKLQQTDEQRNAMLAALPKWANTDEFEIEARAAGNATKDQMRLMMQSLLADRFKLAVHFETREVPVLVLTTDKLLLRQAWAEAPSAFRGPCLPRIQGLRSGLRSRAVQSFSRYSAIQRGSLVNTTSTAHAGITKCDHAIAGRHGSAQRVRDRRDR